jgi:hypothetical protein
MFDVSIVLIIGFALVLAVLVRIGITLADISNSLERLEANGINATAGARALSTGTATANVAEEAEIALAIALAQAARDGSLNVKDSAAKA